MDSFSFVIVKKQKGKTDEKKSNDIFNVNDVSFRC